MHFSERARQLGDLLYFKIRDALRDRIIPDMLDDAIQETAVGALEGDFDIDDVWQQALIYKRRTYRFYTYPGGRQHISLNSDIGGCEGFTYEDRLAG